MSGNGFGICNSIREDDLCAVVRFRSQTWLLRTKVFSLGARSFCVVWDLVIWTLTVVGHSNWDLGASVAELVSVTIVAGSCTTGSRF